MFSEIFSDNFHCVLVIYFHLLSTGWSADLKSPVNCWQFSLQLYSDVRSGHSDSGFKNVLRRQEQSTCGVTFGIFSFFVYFMPSRGTLCGIFVLFCFALASSFSFLLSFYISFLKYYLYTIVLTLFGQRVGGVDRRILPVRTLDVYNLIKKQAKTTKRIDVS